MAMSVVIIGPQEQAEIAKLVAHARANYIPWAVLRASALPDHKGPLLTLAQRKSVPKRPEPHHLMLGSTEVAFSFEEQPAGLCRHLSVAVQTKGRLPHPEAVALIAEAFGFTGFPPVDGTVWSEEYEPGRYAINVVEVAEPAQGGHA